MDSITHALVAILLFPASLTGSLALFPVLGATLPDIDILLKRISDRDPALFIFSHGGFTHSIPGVLAVSAGAGLGFLAWQISAGQDAAPALILMGCVLSLGGALTHLFLDALAFPGIPLLYPGTPRKFTAGIFPGPSLVLLAGSLGFFMAYILGYPILPLLPVLAALGIFYILAHVFMKVVVAAKHPGITVPTFNPLKWLVIAGSPGAYCVYYTGIGTKPGKMTVYPAYDGVDPALVQRHSNDPEVRRLTYYSYITVAALEGGDVVIRDPLREDGLLYYPPSYTRVRLPRNDGETR